MNIAIGNDHAGLPLKRHLLKILQDAGHAVEDLGAHDDKSVDYPDYARAVGEAVINGQAEVGILLCGSGVGASIAANKITGIRAALCHDAFSARQSREDDDANVLCLGPRVIGPKLAQVLLRIFIDTKFSGIERHRCRLEKVLELERRGGD